MGNYEPVNFETFTLEGNRLQCRSYRAKNKNATDRHPSPQYLDVMLRGAIENKLPEDYIAKLRQIEHNGYSGVIDLQQLKPPDRPLQ